MKNIKKKAIYTAIFTHLLIGLTLLFMGHFKQYIVTNSTQKENLNIIYSSTVLPNQKPLISINTSNIIDIQLIPQIGPNLAQRIIKHKDNQGIFCSQSELESIYGIGQKKSKAIMQYIELNCK